MTHQTLSLEKYWKLFAATLNVSQTPALIQKYAEQQQQKKQKKGKVPTVGRLYHMRTNSVAPVANQFIMGKQIDMDRAREYNTNTVRSCHPCPAKQENVFRWVGERAGDDPQACSLRMSYKWSHIHVFIRDFESDVSVTNVKQIVKVHLRDLVSSFQNPDNIPTLKSNSLFPSCLKPLYQSEAWCATIHMKMSLIYM